MASFCQPVECRLPMNVDPVNVAPDRPSEPALLPGTPPSITAQGIFMFDAPAFRLTINMPAPRPFFHDDRIIGTRVRLQDGEVMFRPATNLRGDDTVRLQTRHRGG